MTAIVFIGADEAEIVRALVVTRMELRIVLDKALINSALDDFTRDMRRVVADGAVRQLLKTLGRSPKRFPVKTVVRRLPQIGMQRARAATSSRRQFRRRM